jgi:hypothetical protein
MFFMNGSRAELVNSKFIERIRILEQSDAFLVDAIFANNSRPVTLARYASLREASSALEALLAYLSEGYALALPSSTGTYKPDSERKNGYHGGKPTRHGGS